MSTKEAQLTDFPLKSHTRDKDKYEGFSEECLKKDNVQFWQVALNGGYFILIWRTDVESTNMLIHPHVL